MKRRSNRHELLFISEISTRPLLDFFFVLLPVAAVMVIVLFAVGKNAARPAASAILTTSTSAPVLVNPAPAQPAVVTPPPQPPPAPAVVPPVVAMEQPPANVTPTIQIVSETPVGGANMKPVKEAIIDAFRQSWAQPGGLTGDGQLVVQMDVVIARDGRVMSYLLGKPSGQSQVDMSVLRAAGLIKRIAIPLPAEFSGDSYEVQMHFRAR